VNSSRGTSSGSPARAPGQSAATGSGSAVTAAAYLALFVLGGLLGLIGTFQFSRGPVPLAAILFDAAILVTCVLGSWGMRAAPGGILPAAGWFIVTLLLTSTSSGGSVIVTATTAGMWFLYGGAVCAAGGIVFAVARWSRPRRDRRR
jgi:hypothetical protein